MDERVACYIAIDLGASSGRVVLGRRDQCGLQHSVIFRFSHTPISNDGRLRWDWETIRNGYRQGLTLAAEHAGDLPICSVSCSAWAQDFGLLDPDGKLFYPPVSYRDPLLPGGQHELFKRISASELLERVGVTQLPITTLIQLFTIALREPRVLPRAAHLLHIADLVHHDLCGQSRNDATLAAASQLCRLGTQQWDTELLTLLGIPISIFSAPIEGPQIVGSISAASALPEKLRGVPVVMTAGHDTAAAFHTMDDEGLASTTACISAGTYTMLGSVTSEPVLIRELADKGYACIQLLNNQFGLFGSCAGLKLLTDLRSALASRGLPSDEDDLVGGQSSSADAQSNARICKLDVKNLDPGSRTDDGDLIDAITAACARQGVEVPRTSGEFAKVLFDSLAADFARGIQDLQQVLGRKFQRVRIVSGGSKNSYLCQRLADITGLEVIAGPCEATSLGNLLLQIQLAEKLSAQEVALLRESASNTSAYRPETLCN